MKPFFVRATTALVLAALACSAPPAPDVVPRTNRFLVDPSLGFAGEIPPATTKRADAAWSTLVRGSLERAEEQYAALQRRDPEYRPATLALAAIALERNDIRRAESLIALATEGVAPWTAAEIYRGEVAYAKGDLGNAYSAYRAAASLPAAPSQAIDRREQIRNEFFGVLYKRAIEEASPVNAIPLLREALAVSPEASAARLLLAEKLIGVHRYDEARHALDPFFLRGESDRPDVQELLAEIDVGQQRFDEAIARLERLARNQTDPRFANRLREVKRLWSEANMPPQYRMAIESSSITRADLAVLIYWKVSAIRFAPAAEPPIAIDVADVAGRDEFVKALALRFYSVDPVTRQADPYRVMTASSFLRIAARVLTLRGTPPCAAAAAGESNELARAIRALEGCGVFVDELRVYPESPVRGTDAGAVLDRIDAILAGSGF